MGESSFEAPESTDFLEFLSKSVRFEIFGLKKKPFGKSDFSKSVWHTIRVHDIT